MLLLNMFNSKGMIKDSLANTSNEGPLEKDNLETTTNKEIITSQENTIRDSTRTEIPIINQITSEEEIFMRRGPMSNTTIKASKDTSNSKDTNSSKDTSNKDISSSKDINNEDIKLKGTSRTISKASNNRAISKTSNNKDINNIKSISKIIIFGTNSTLKLEIL